MNHTAPVELEPVDAAEVTIVMDNSIDLLLTNTELAKRPRFGPDMFERQLPVAEHGFSALITVRRGEQRGTVLFDTGLNPRNLLYNLDSLEIDARDIQAVVLSHGHPDHAMGLPGLVERLGPRNVPILLHPDALLERKLVLPNGHEVNLPPPRLADLRREGIAVDVVQEAGPVMLVDEMLLISGEVGRTTEFEHGLPNQQALRDGRWVPDPLVMDDQCVIINVRGKGLVVITGCGHAGVINIVRQSQRLTGVRQVYAVVGGFHLNGPMFEPVIPPTIEALQEINPAYIVPGHCTGWRATHLLARAMPGAFVQSSVGTKLVL